MIKAAQAESRRESAELISVGVLSGEGKRTHGGTAVPARTTEGDGATTAAVGHRAEQGSAPHQTINGLKTRQKEVGFQILAGTAQRLLAGLNAGAVGAVLAFATPAPTACYEIYAAWKEGDADLARLKQDRISATAVRVASELGIPALKYALDLNGYYGGQPRLPLLPLTAEVKAEVEKLMSDIRN
jgi:dihydrodipicolinate synthase/N-acetylneuraminate lyase